MKTILPIASGKGGVGKTIFTANLGVALAKLGKTTILIDLDLGSSNLHTTLGLKNRYPGIGSFIYKKEPSVESLVIKTDIDQLFFIPGDSLLPGTANLAYFTKLKLMKEIQELTADYILIDLGAGSSYNVVDFFLMSPTGIIVTTPEATSILSAYSFIKTMTYRLLFRSYRAKSAERNVIGEFITERFEGSGVSFQNLIEQLAAISPESGKYAEEQLKSIFPKIVINMGRTNQDLAIGSKLRSITVKNIGTTMEYIGFLGYDQMIGRSLLEGQPFFELHSESPFSKNLIAIAQKIIASPAHSQPKLFEADEDIKELEEQADL